MSRYALSTVLLGVFLTGCGTAPSSALAFQRAVRLAELAVHLVDDPPQLQTADRGFRGLYVLEYRYLFYGNTLDDHTHLRYDIGVANPIESDSFVREALVSVYSAPPFARRMHYLLRWAHDEWHLVQRARSQKRLRKNVRDPYILRFLDSDWGQFHGKRFCWVEGNIRRVVSGEGVGTLVTN